LCERLAARIVEMIKSIKWQMTIVAGLLWLIAANCQAQSAETPKRPQQLLLLRGLDVSVVADQEVERLLGRHPSTALWISPSKRSIQSCESRLM